MSAPWVIERYAARGDVPESLRRYVLQTWARSSRSCKLEHDNQLAQRLLTRSICDLLVAEHVDFRGVAAGWALITPTAPPVIHYVYVRQLARRGEGGAGGCATALCTAAGLGTKLLTSQRGRLPAAVRSRFPAHQVVDPEHALL